MEPVRLLPRSREWAPLSLPLHIAFSELLGAKQQQPQFLLKWCLLQVQVQKNEPC